MVESITNPFHTGRPLKNAISKELGFYFDPWLWSNLEMLRNAVLFQDYDGVILVDGGEGKGKSVLALQVGVALDVDHVVDLDTQVCYYNEQFKKSVLSLKKGKVVIWDEARRGLNRRRSTDKVNIDITDMLAECRQHNLFLIIVMPTFYDMDMNVAVWRSSFLIHVMARWNKDNKERPLQRGYYRLYDDEGKKMLYTNRFYRTSYSYPLLKSHCFDGKFSHYYPVDEQRYRDGKAKAEDHYRSDDKKNCCSSCGSSDCRWRASSSSFMCRKCGNVWGGSAHGINDNRPVRKSKRSK